MVSKFPCCIAITASGQTGVVTTQQNTCLEYASLTGCLRAKCNKYHVKIGHIVDSLPCAHGGPPLVLGPLPEHLKNHRALNGKADWKQEQKDLLKLNYETFKKAKMVTLLEFSQELEQQSEMLEMEKATALMEERKAAYQQNRDRVNRGEAALEFKTTMPIPQLSFLPNLPPMHPRSSAMHQRPAPAPAQESNWPREGPSCRRNAEYRPVTVREEYDSADNSENDTENDKKAVKEFRRRLKEHNIEKARQHAKKAKAASRSPPLPPPLPSGSNA
jgi:hypothetical protein